MTLMLEQKFRWGFLISLIVLLLVGIVAYGSMRRSIETSRMAEHTYRVLALTDDLLIEMLNTETGARGFALTGEISYLAPYESGRRATFQSFARLRELTADDLSQQVRLDRLDPLLHQKVTTVDTMVAMGRDSLPIIAADELETVANGKQIMDDIRSVLKEIKAEESDLLRRRLIDEQTSLQRMLASFIVGGLLTLLVVGYAHRAVHRDLKLRRQAEEALRQSEAEFTNTLESFGEAFTTSQTARKVHANLAQCTVLLSPTSCQVPFSWRNPQ